MCIRDRSLIVCKFGGTSVASPERIQMVAKKLIAKKQAGHQVVAVVSAMGKTTDELVGLAASLNDNPPAREMDRLLSTGEQVSMTLLAMDGQPVALRRFENADAASLVGRDHLGGGRTGCACEDRFRRTGS